MSFLNFIPVDFSSVSNAESVNLSSLLTTFFITSFAKLTLLLRFLEPISIPSDGSVEVTVNKDFARYSEKTMCQHLTDLLQSSFPAEQISVVTEEKYPPRSRGGKNAGFPAV